MQESTWEEIRKIAQSGYAESYYSTGDAKTMTVQYRPNRFAEVAGNVDVDYAIIGINVDGANTITFFSKKWHDEIAVVNRSPGHSLYKTDYDLLPSEIKSVVKKMSFSMVGWNIDNELYTNRISDIQTFGLTAKQLRLGDYNHDYGSVYPYFSSDNRRIVYNPVNEEASEYHTASAGKISMYSSAPYLPPKITQAGKLEDSQYTSSHTDTPYVYAFVIG